MLHWKLQELINRWSNHIYYLGRQVVTTYLWKYLSILIVI